VRTPTWGRVEQFCRIDGWAEARRTDHVFFEKVLDDGTVLRTHRSFASTKTMSPGRFKAILRSQLQVSGDDFWRALDTGQPVVRPSKVPEDVPRLPLYLVRVLTKLGKGDAEIAALSVEEAERIVHEEWSRPPDA